MVDLILHYTPFHTEAGSGYCLWEYRLGAFTKKEGFGFMLQLGVLIDENSVDSVLLLHIYSSI